MLCDVVCDVCVPRMRSGAKVQMQLVAVAWIAQERSTMARGMGRMIDIDAVSEKVSEKRVNLFSESGWLKSGKR